MRIPATGVAPSQSRPAAEAQAAAPAAHPDPLLGQGVAWMAPFRKTEIDDAQLDALTDVLTAPHEDRGVAPETAEKVQPQ